MCRLYRRNILFLFFLGISPLLFSQQAIDAKQTQPDSHPTIVSRNGPVKIMRQRMDSVQSGKATIENGKAVIQLKNKINNAAYEVSITPKCNNCGRFAVSEKSETSFTVQQTGGTGRNITFSYNVYIKPDAGDSPIIK